jgi:hypothetical protein
MLSRANAEKTIVVVWWWEEESGSRGGVRNFMEIPEGQ